MSGYAVFQAYNGEAAQELCRELPDIGLLVLNTEGTGMDLPILIQSVRETTPGLPVLHIGSAHPANMPLTVKTIPESFTSDQLLAAVRDLLSSAELLRV